jgi:hypothetical protein
MSRWEDVALAGRALRPDYHQYFIAYTSAATPGLQIINTWSPNGLEAVEGAFLLEFCQELPQVLFITCPGAN